MIFFCVFATVLVAYMNILLSDAEWHPQVV